MEEVHLWGCSSSEQVSKSWGGTEGEDITQVYTLCRTKHWVVQESCIAVPLAISEIVAEQLTPYVFHVLMCFLFLVSQESRNSTRQQGCGLTRDSVVSRMVFSCMQTLASPSTPSSSASSSYRVNRRPAHSQKDIMPPQAYTRFNEYMQVRNCL